MVKVIAWVCSSTDPICLKSVLKLNFQSKIQFRKSIELKETLVANKKSIQAITTEVALETK